MIVIRETMKREGIMETETMGRVTGYGQDREPGRP